MRLIVKLIILLMPCLSYSEESVVTEAVKSIQEFGCNSSNVLENQNSDAYSFMCVDPKGSFLMFSIQKRNHVCDARRLSDDECKKGLSKISQMPARRLIDNVEDVLIEENVYVGKWRDGNQQFYSKGIDSGDLIYSLVYSCNSALCPPDNEIISIDESDLSLDLFNSLGKQIDRLREENQ